MGTEITDKFNCLLFSDLIALLPALEVAATHKLVNVLLGRFFVLFLWIILFGEI